MPLIRTTDASAVVQVLSPGSSPLVAIPVYNAADHFIRCLDSVLRHTPPGTDILVVDDAGTDRSAIDGLDRLSTWTDHTVIVYSKTENQGYVRACNDVFAMSGRRDVIVLNSDCIVGPEWYERLSAAATSSNQIATVSTLTNHGTILSVPDRNRPSNRLPDDMSVDQAAIRVARSARMSRPDVPTSVGHCLLVRRRALDAVGDFDVAFGRGYGDEVDFSQRCIRVGLRNILADDVFVHHVGRGSFGASSLSEQQSNDRVVETRYAYYAPLIAAASDDRYSALTAALDTADAALRGLRIGIDARKLSAINVGTQSVIAGSILGLHDAMADGTLSVFIAPDLDTDRLGPLGRLDDVAWVHTDGSPVSEPLVDVIFRPCQVDNWDDLAWLHTVGRRVVVNQLDVIAFSNPQYFASIDEWWGYRDLTRLALLTADGTSTVSEFSRSEIDRLGLVADPTRLRAIHHGSRTDQLTEEMEESQPQGFDDSGVPFLLCVGVAYHHKNRLFCVRLLRQMRSEGWDGRLVFIGPRPDFGDSSAMDLFETLGDSDLMKRIIDLGAVSESSKRWLYARASLSLYPSTVEGFGLIPFESASFGTPVLFTDHGSLGELLPEVANLPGLDLIGASQTARHLLTCSSCATEQIERIMSRSTTLTWENYGNELLGYFRDILSRPKNRCAAVFGDRDHAVSSSALSRQRRLLRPRYHRIVGFARSHPRLKRIASPDGSRRQAALRAVIHRSRVAQHRRNVVLEPVR